MGTLNLKRVLINHKTYHHFVGKGQFDSEIDVILQTSNTDADEKVDHVYCRTECCQAQLQLQLQL